MAKGPVHQRHPVAPGTPRGRGEDAAAATRGGASLLVLQTAGRLVGLGFVVVATRHVSPAEFGRYSTAAAIVLFANFLADFGTSPTITRLSSRNRGEADALLSGTLPVSLAFGLIAYAGAVGFALAAYSGVIVVDVAIAGLAIPAASLLSSVLGALDGEGLIARRAVVTVIQTLVVAAGVVPVLFGAGVRAPIWTLAAAPYVALGVAVAITRRRGVWRSGLHFDGPRSRLLLRAALPIALSGGLTALAMRFDVILISVLRSPPETATYDLALRLLEASTYMGAAVCGPLLFILSRRFGEGDFEGMARAYREASRVLYLLGLPVSVGLVVLARPVVAVALGPGFDDVAQPLAIMGAGQWLTFVIAMQGALVMAGDSVGRGVAVGVLNTAVLVVLDLVLVPIHGVKGAAAAMVGSWVFAVAALDVYHRRTSRVSTPLPPFRILAAAAALGVAVFLLRHGPVAVAAGVGAAAYAGSLWLTGAVRGSELRRLRFLLAGQEQRT